MRMSEEELQAVVTRLVEAIQTEGKTIIIRDVKTTPPKRRKFSIEEVEKILDETVIGRLTEYEKETGQTAAWCPNHDFVFAGERGCQLCQHERYHFLFPQTPRTTQMVGWRVAQLLRKVGPNLGEMAMALILNVSVSELIDALNGLANIGLASPSKAGDGTWVWEGSPADLSPIVHFLRIGKPADLLAISKTVGWPVESIRSDLEDLQKKGLVEEREDGWAWVGDPILDEELKED